ncbi:MAG: DUF1003 domain-containing protein [Myxococcales bacterium]|nr:DUF1003 domain-containing protein [Myxococcales bacterium]
MPQHSRELSAHERRIVDAILQDRPISRDALKDAHEQRTLGERVADRIAAFGGSWTFIITCLGLLSCWMLVNSLVLPGDRAFDPYPFILLNLGLSMLAALQAPVILMSQNRQAARDRTDAAHDYEVNLKAELEIRHLHEKLDELREQKWLALVEMQQKQIEMLQRLLAARDQA